MTFPILNIRKLKTLATSFLFIFVTLVHANEAESAFKNANTEYEKGNYDAAIKLYESIAKGEQEAVSVYYNLGNAYFKTNNIAFSILNYERAKKLQPENEDILFNLKLANQKIEDKIDEIPQLFITEWKDGIVHQLTERSWSMLFISSLITSLLLFVLYTSSSNRNAKQIGFFGGSVVLILSVFFSFTAKHKYNDSLLSSHAIITSASVTATGSPNEEGTKLFVLHEGTKVSIKQKSNKWIEIKIANGNVGWVKSTTLEAI